MAIGGDLALPEVEGPRPLGVRVINAYIGLLLTATERDPVLFERFARVSNFIDPPIKLFHPAVLRRVAAGSLRRRTEPTVVPDLTPPAAGKTIP